MNVIGCNIRTIKNIDLSKVNEEYKNDLLNTFSGKSAAVLKVLFDVPYGILKIEYFETDSGNLLIEGTVQPKE